MVKALAFFLARASSPVCFLLLHFNNFCSHECEMGVSAAAVGRVRQSSARRSGKALHVLILSGFSRRAEDWRALPSDLAAAPATGFIEAL